MPMKVRVVVKPIDISVLIAEKINNDINKKTQVQK